MVHQFWSSVTLTGNETQNGYYATGPGFGAVSP